MKGLLVPVAFAVVMVGTAALAFALGTGAASLLAGIAAVMCVIAAFGGTLAGDLRFFVVFGPVMVGVVAGPRLLNAVSPLAAMAVVAVVVFVAGVLPGLGSRYRAVALAIGLGVVFGYAYPLPAPVSWLQLVGGAVVAVVVAVVIRVAAGVVDPRRPVRDALAALLTDAKPGIVAEAIRLVRQDAPRRWSVEVFTAAMAYRSAAAMLRAREAAHRAAPSGSATSPVVTNVAAVIRAHRPAALDAAEQSSAGCSVPDAMLAALRRAATAASDRDETRYPVPADSLWWVERARWDSVLSWRSDQFRHAVRTTVAMIAVLALATLEPADPLKVTLLAVTFGIVQPAWSDTVVKLRQRFLGVLAGVVLLAVAVWLAPEPWLFPIGIGSLFVGLIFISTIPAIYYGASVLLSVGTKATTSGFDPVALLIEYPLLVAGAAAVGLFFGFVAVPWMRTPSSAELVRAGKASTAELLRGVTQSLAQELPDMPRLRALLGVAALARQNLIDAPPAREEGADGRSAAVNRVSDGLGGLAASAIDAFVNDHPSRDVRALNLARDRLSPAQDDETMALPGDSVAPDQKTDLFEETIWASLELVSSGERTLAGRTDTMPCSDHSAGSSR